MPKSSDPAAIAEFEKDFWLAQKEHFESRGKPLSAAPAHRRSLALSKKKHWKWAETLLEASSLFYSREYTRMVGCLKNAHDVPPQCQGLRHYLLAYAFVELDKNDDAIDFCNKCIEDENFSKASYARLPLGIALRRRRFFDEALKTFEKTLKDETFDRRRNAYNCIGNLELAQSHFTEALAAYQEALENEGLIGDEDILYNIATTYWKRGDYNQAINAYKKALKSPLKTHRSVVFNALGNVYVEKKDYTNAVDNYRKSLRAPNPRKIATIWANLGHSLFKLEKKKEAVTAFKNALKVEDPTNRAHPRAQLGLALLTGKVKPEGLDPSDRALINQPGTTNNFRSGLEKSLKHKMISAVGTKYEEYMNIPSSSLDDSLIVMRGWSSALPLLESATKAGRGGGYFIKWRGYGLVLDPGFDFLRNMQDLGIHGREINAVVVSHNHSDHQYDLRAIDDLRYELYLRRESGTKNNIMPYVLVWDEDTAKSVVFPVPKPEHQLRPIVLSAGQPGKADLSGAKSYLPFTVHSFRVEHGIEIPGALGYVIELIDQNGGNPIRIGYTGDTRFFTDLPDHLEKCDILIAHISQPELQEFDADPKPKRAHLGYRGVIKLLEKSKPKLALIGEFWAGFDDLRIDLTKAIRSNVPSQPIFPTAIGMTVQLKNNSIRCTECDHWAPPTDIRVTPPTEAYGPLGYLCQHCIFSH